MRIIKIMVFLSLAAFVYSCGGGGSGGSGSPANSPSKEHSIRNYNLNVQKEQAKRRTPYDTLALKEYILKNYSVGTYLVNSAKTYTFSVPKPAVIYYRKGGNYIFALLAKSKKGERFIETKNIVGYYSSFINLDSTKLGTAFFYLTLFQYDEKGNFDTLWQAEVPIHGGFNYMKLKRWRAKNELYIKLDFDAGIISGHRDFNFFFVDGIKKRPHLLETYEGIAHKRTIANLNNDKYPDYYEYIFSDSSKTIPIIDSIPFYWSKKRHLYITKRNRRWWRKY